MSSEQLFKAEALCRVKNFPFRRRYMELYLFNDLKIRSSGRKSNSNEMSASLEE